MRLALRRPYTGPYDHEYRGIRVKRGLAVIALVAAAAIGWTLRGSSHSATRTVTRTITTAAVSPTVFQHTPRGAVAAAQAFFYERAITPQRGPLAVTNPHVGQVSGDWQLLYEVKSYTTDSATIEAWGLELAYGYGNTGLDWTFTDVDVRWNGRRWVQAGDLTIAPQAATPPPNGTTGHADRAFGRLLYPYRRFPGEP